ncbi:MAG: indolepyruvate ferredoxin oxidoreductase family protein [Acetobacteraceae bacterium]|nr:indolepyruvate ferredoxin oxidoreductase family protein [Acetobacteraceae bacterium]
MLDVTSLATSLDDRFSRSDAPVLLNGTQALVRLLLEQARADADAGLDTRGFVSGYRGSPLGRLDQELWAHQALLDQHRITFTPGLNEDLAATMAWGTQQLEIFPGARTRGVFAMWYGKGPGVDRSGDAFRHANMVGTSALGGVLAVAGDDHAAQSSTFAHQSDFAFQAAMMPLLYPASIDDYLPLGLAGYALSRFSGLWVGFKAVTETSESGGTLAIPHPRFRFPDIRLPPHGLNMDPRLRWPAQRAEFERRITAERLPAARAWAAVNRLDSKIFGRADATIGIVTVGKAHTDAMRALSLLGLSPETAAAQGIALYRIVLAWPLEAEGLKAFAAGKQLLWVIEEKRPFVEPQIAQALFNLAADRRPTLAGKADANGAPLLGSEGELSPELVAEAMAKFLGPHAIRFMAPAVRPITREPGLLARTAFFCSGCPHNSSTRVPEGSYANGGIGCHIMALGVEPTTLTFTHMGAEGATWAGMAPFTDTRHMFVNIGDGTWQHSGILAFRQSVAAGVNTTYKILVNDAVAMTGGQPVEGGLTPDRIARQCAAEGAGAIAVVADEAAHLPPASSLPKGATRHLRAELDAVQRRLAAVEGTTALVYVQVCATEKRRRRKRGTMPPADVAIAINPDVCEGCGDCSIQSHCIAVEPVETELGRKRRISPTACNADLSCLKGFCPSFVTAKGGFPKAAPDARWATLEAELAPALAEPPAPQHEHAHSLLFGGIGGGGIVTAGAVVAMAAQMDGWHVRTLDFTGLAQKNGAVVSHVQVAREAGQLDVARIPEATASLLVAADLAVGAAADVLHRCARACRVVGNLDLAPTAGFVFDRDQRIDAGLHRRVIDRATAGAENRYLHAGRIAETLFGTAQAMNTILLGIALQHGWLPVSRAALERAITLNGTAVALNQRALLWGRLLAMRPELGEEILAPVPAQPDPDPLIARRAEMLAAYQNAAYGERYRTLLGPLAGAPASLRRAAAESLFKLMAYKDEYEVARLHLAGAALYGDARQLTFHLAPPLLSRTDPATGRRRKVAIPGRIALPVFRVLAAMKPLRGSWLDPFGHQHERRAERRMIKDFTDDLALIARTLNPGSLDTALALAQIPAEVRGYGPVKMAAFRAAWAKREGLRTQLQTGKAAAIAA